MARIENQGSPSANALWRLAQLHNYLRRIMVAHIKGEVYLVDRSRHGDTATYPLNQNAADGGKRASIVTPDNCELLEAIQVELHDLCLPEIARVDIRYLPVDSEGEYTPAKGAELILTFVPRT